MYQLQTYSGCKIFWQRVSLFARTYQLVAAYHILATLTLGSWGYSATAMANEGYFSIERVGQFHLSYHIYYAGRECAIYTPIGGRSNILQIATGNVFYWRSMGFFSSEMAWKDASDNLIMHFSPSFWDGRYYVTIAPEAGNISELSLLAILGRYLFTLNTRKSEVGYWPLSRRPFSL